MVRRSWVAGLEGQTGVGSLWAPLIVALSTRLRFVMAVNENAPVRPRFVQPLDEGVRDDCRIADHSHVNRTPLADAARSMSH
jgi:hypothetical protein